MTEDEALMARVNARIPSRGFCAHGRVHHYANGTSGFELVTFSSPGGLWAGWPELTRGQGCVLRLSYWPHRTGD